MAKRRGHMANYGRHFLAILALVVVALAAAATHSAEWQPPVLVENPFVGAKLAVEPVEPPSESWTPPAAIAGGKVDVDVPPMYRLPPVEGEPEEFGSDVRESEPDEPSPSPSLQGRGTLVPLTPEPPAEMLDDMEVIWSDEEIIDDTDAAAEDTVGAVPYTPSLAELSQQLLPSVRRGYGLAQRGAIYAAEAEFVKVLRRVAEANDAQQQSDAHSRALAAGLRALDEADDFMPAGTQLEAEIDVAVIASSHRTPVLEGRAETTPHEAVALYHDFARQQLGNSVGGERAGSMALHGLGKLHNRLAHDSEVALRHERKAMALFLAALEAGPDNHLAANEVGVLLARGGRPEEAAAMFRRAIDAAPSSTAYRNLAVVERNLGRFAQADANARYAAELAARDRAAGRVSRSKGVTWVPPQELARATPMQPPPMHEAKTQAAAPPRRESDVVRWPGVGAPASAGTAARWPQKLIPSAFRR